MKILHIAEIKNNPLSGVCVAVPQHVTFQGLYADTALLNLNKGLVIPGVKNQSTLMTGEWENDVLPEFRNPDLVVFHEVYHKEFYCISRELKRKKTPYLIIPHGSLNESAQKKKRMKKLLANMLLFKRFVNDSIALQCLSEAEVINTHFHNIKFIGTNGVVIPSLYKDKFNTQNLTITYIGRFDFYNKGIDILLDALSATKDFLLDLGTKVFLYGPKQFGWDVEVQSLIDRKNLSDLITLCPPVFGKDKEECLLHSDLFIQTSRSEGMPMGILEALGYGLPCIVTKGTTLGGIIEKYNAGWVAETSVHSVAEAIINAVLEKDRFKEVSLNARKLVKDNFSWQYVAKVAVDKYRELISEYKF